MNNEFCNLTHTWFKRIDTVFSQNNVNIIFIAIFQFFWQLEIYRHSIWNNGFCWIQDITIFNSFSHGVAIKRYPHRFRQSTTELAEFSKRFLTWCGSKTYQQILFYYSLATHIECLLQTGEEVNHFLIVFARITTMNLIYEESHTHFLQFLSCCRQCILQIQKLLDIHHDDSQFAVQSLDECVAVSSFYEH